MHVAYRMKVVEVRIRGNPAWILIVRTHRDLSIAEWNKYTKFSILKHLVDHWQRIECSPYVVPIRILATFWSQPVARETFSNSGEPFNNSANICFICFTLKHMFHPETYVSPWNICFTLKHMFHPETYVSPWSTDPDPWAISCGIQEKVY
jgi:hypothetical protein